MDPATRLVEENSTGRVKGDGGCLEGWNKHLGSLDHAERDMWIKTMERALIHGRGENSSSRVQQIQHLRAHYVFFSCCLSGENPYNLIF